MKDTTGSLLQKRCRPCEGGVDKLSRDVAKKMLNALDSDWQLHDDTDEIFRTFKFKNYYQTIAFVNAIAWFTHQEDHHPNLSVSYNQCTVRYSTHAIHGLSENDFICAAKVDQLLTY